MNSPKSPVRFKRVVRLLPVAVTLLSPQVGRAQGSISQDTSAAREVRSWAMDSAAVAFASTAWMRALQMRDSVALDSLMASEFRLTVPTSEVEGVDKTTWIRNALTVLRTDSAGYRIMRYRSVGPDVVVGSGVLYWRMRIKGWPIPMRYHAVTDVWVRRAGAWQIVAREADMAPGTFMKLGALAGAVLTSMLWAVVAWVQRRRRP